MRISVCRSRRSVSATAANLVSGTVYSYKVFWGDNSTSVGSITGTGTTRTFTTTKTFRDNGSFSSTGVYSATGSYALIVQVLQGTTTLITQNSGIATISNAVPTAPANTSQTVAALAALASTSFVLATTTAPFADLGFSSASAPPTPWMSAETFSATVNWGDGSSVQSVIPSVVNGAAGTTTKITLPNTSHTFSKASSYSVVIDVLDDEGAKATKTIAVTVTGIAITSGNEGNSGAAPSLSANFTGLTIGTLYNYEILWGDNQTSTASFTPTTTSFTVTGSHRYADNGSFTSTGVYSPTGDYGIEVRVKQGTVLKFTQFGVVTIANVAPTPPLALTATVSTLVSNTFALGTFTDPGFSIGTVGQPWGSAETFTASIA